MSTSNPPQSAATQPQAPLQVQTSSLPAANANSSSATSPARAKAAAAALASSSGISSSQDVEAASAGAAELTTAVDALLEDVRKRYSDVSRDLLSRMDDMSRRLDVLEASLRGSGGAGHNSNSSA